MSTPNPFYLPAIERAKCEHIERQMTTSGVSDCPECHLEAIAAMLKPVEAYEGRPNLCVPLPVPVTSYEAACFQNALWDDLRELEPEVAYESDEETAILRVYVKDDNLVALARCSQWFFNKEYKAGAELNRAAADA
jgi:hypothetical protein